MKKPRNYLKIVGATVAAATLALAPLAPAHAAATSSWGIWDAAPIILATDSIAFGNAAFPDATYTVTGGWTFYETLNVTDEDEWFTADTPIGAVFGANGPSATNNFLKIESLSDTSTDAILTVTFASPTTAGNLGFAVSDLDSDHVTVEGTDGGGGTISGEDLIGSASGTEAFNFCDVPDSPGGCSDTAVPDVYAYATEVYVDGVVDGTDGSTAWFRPSVSVSTLTFTYRNDDDGNTSTSRYWFAQLEPELPNTGQSASVLLGMFGIGIALLSAGALILARRRHA